MDNRHMSEDRRWVAELPEGEWKEAVEEFYRAADAWSEARDAEAEARRRFVRTEDRVCELELAAGICCRA